MCMEIKEKRIRKIVCPQCGKATNVSIEHLEGELRYSLRCRSCKQVSEVTIKKHTIESLETFRDR